MFVKGHITSVTILLNPMTWMVLNAQWRTSQEKSCWTWIWCHHSSQLHDIGCWKPAFSCPSQEWGLYSFAICTRLFSTAKESLKRTTAWSAYYYTSLRSWYPVPERSLGLFEIPSMSQTSVVKASKDEISMMREWARAHVCQTFHQKEIEVGERIDLSSNSVAATDISSVSNITDAEDKVTEHDSKQWWRNL